MPLASLFRQSIKSLIKILNRVGDKGHLCFTPRLKGMGRDRLLFTFMVQLVFVYSAFMAWSTMLLIPTCSNYFHSRSLGLNQMPFLSPQTCI